MNDSPVPSQSGTASRFYGFITDYKIPLILGGISIFLLSTGLILFVRTQPPQDTIQFFSSDASSSANLGSIAVDIEGAVTNPGMYSMPYGSRVEDVLVKAGGFSHEADTEYVGKIINRAMLVQDGMKIYIPTESERATSGTSYNANTVSGATETSYNLDQGSVAGVTTKTISLNSASQSELESLNGVGPVTAQKIISNRPYIDPHEVVTKKAMSESLFGKLKSQLSL